MLLPELLKAERALTCVRECNPKRGLMRTKTQTNAEKNKAAPLFVTKGGAAFKFYNVLQWASLRCAMMPIVKHEFKIFVSKLQQLW